MIIRQKQVGQLEHAAEESFEDRAIAHLRRCFPAECRGLSDRELRELVESGIEKSSGYEIATERDVCHYLDLMMVFGQNFDKDEKQPWAARILNDKLYTNGTARMERLYEEARRHA